MSVTIYLAGPVATLDDGGAGWRESVLEYLGGDETVEALNPLDKYNVPVDDLTVVHGMSDEDDETTVGTVEIVGSDKQLVEASDAVLVGYEDVKSIGTPMEVMYAYDRDKPVGIWIRDETDAEELSPWYRHHASAVTNSLPMAIGHLKRKVGSDD